MIIWIIAAVCAVLLIISLRIRLKVRHYNIEVKNLPTQADGIIIAHLSDFHDRTRRGLFEAVSRAKPDLIFISGDFMDYGRDNEVSIDLAEKLVEISPVYYCPGNHEKQCPDYEEMMVRLADTGVIVLRDNCAYSHGMRIVGFEDINEEQKPSRHEIFKASIDKLQTPEFSVALFHHSNLFGLFKGKNYSIVFGGHVHGGQVRLPFGKGLISPEFEFLPEYCGGVYVRGDAHFIASRGLVFYPHFPRFFNPPELVIVKLRIKS